MNRSYRDKRKQRGASLVETALALPLLAIMFMGMLDLGRFFTTHLAVARIAAEGTRYASKLPGLAGSQGASRRADVQSRTMQIANLDGFDVVTSVDVIYDSANETVRITVTVPFVPFFRRLGIRDRVRASAEAPYFYPNSL